MPRSLWERAVFLLSRREYSKAELAARLKRYDLDTDEEIAAILQKLMDLDYLNEERYAKSRARLKAERYGNRRIVADLKAHGVADDAAIAESLLSIDEESARCLAVWQKRFNAPPADSKELAQQGRFLCARGFPAAMVFALLKKVSRGE